MKDKELKKLLSKKIKPLSGNNRSFSNRATKRSFNTNRQKYQIGSKVHHIPVRLFRGYWTKLKRSL